jgi:hypothetical protein
MLELSFVDFLLFIYEVDSRNIISEVLESLEMARLIIYAFNDYISHDFQALDHTYSAPERRLRAKIHLNCHLYW